MTSRQTTSLLLYHDQLILLFYNQTTNALLYYQLILLLYNKY